MIDGYFRHGFGPFGWQNYNVIYLFCILSSQWYSKLVIYDDYWSGYCIGSSHFGPKSDPKLDPKWDPWLDPKWDVLIINNELSDYRNFNYKIQNLTTSKNSGKIFWFWSSFCQTQSYLGLKGKHFNVACPLYQTVISLF